MLKTLLFCLNILLLIGIYSVPGGSSSSESTGLVHVTPVLVSNWVKGLDLLGSTVLTELHVIITRVLHSSWGNIVLLELDELVLPESGFVVFHLNVGLVGNIGIVEVLLVSLSGFSMHWHSVGLIFRSTLGEVVHGSWGVVVMVSGGRHRARTAAVDPYPRGGGVIQPPGMCIPPLEGGVVGTARGTLSGGVVWHLG